MDIIKEQILGVSLVHVFRFSAQSKSLCLSVRLLTAAFYSLIASKRIADGCDHSRHACAAD